jgi:hypothetical protein
MEEPSIRLFIRWSIKPFHNTIYFEMLIGPNFVADIIIIWFCSSRLFRLKIFKPFQYLWLMHLLGFLVYLKIPVMGCMIWNIPYVSGTGSQR